MCGRCSGVVRREGSIALTGFLGRTATIELAGAIATDTALFAAWLALRDWNNAAQVSIHNQ